MNRPDLRPQKNDVLRVKHRRTLERRLAWVERQMTADQTHGRETPIFRMQEAAAIKNALLMADRAVELRAERDELAKRLRLNFWLGWVSSGVIGLLAQTVAALTSWRPW